MTQIPNVARLTTPVSGRDYQQGPASAPITLVEYGDYECPYCGKAYHTVKELQRRMGDQLRFVFRNFPLTQLHPFAENAAEAAEAAGVQGKFWEMHDTLFEHQQALDNNNLVSYAVALDLDEGKFIYELTKHVYATRMLEDVMSGTRSGVNGTPTFFINGLRYDYSYDLSTFLAALRAV
jgi:protein-disulfide isomerase